jgi:SIR2-like protein
MDLAAFKYNRRRDVAIVLGAGATRGAHFVTPSAVSKPPLDRDFFTLLRSSGLANHDVRRLLEFVDREFGSLDVGMETFYSQAFLYDQFIHDVPSGGRGRRREYKWNLAYIRRCLPLLFGTALRDKECAFHAALVAALSPGDTIISFNYDCLMDRALARYAGRRWRPAEGYGYAVSAGDETWCDHAGPGRPPRRSIKLLKAHGSLNWVLDSDELSLIGNEYEARDEEGLIIVPPLWQKSFDAEPYQTIWQETRRVLSAVKALFIIGYSLPETDVYTQATLRMDVGELEFLCIVNPDEHARQRAIRTLRSAITTETHLVEFSQLADLAALLPAVVL